MRKLLGIAVLLFGLCAGAILGLMSCQRHFWERALKGPFIGRPFTETIATHPTSVLSIPAAGQLEVHEFHSYTNPVVLLRSPRGGIQWAQLLLPERRLEDGKVEQAALRDLRLLSWERRATGSVVRVTCFWEWGGFEGGLIMLGPDHEFRSFSLSW